MKKQSGQALVLVLLSLAVVLTIVLFVLARSVTDVAVSSRSEEAVRAFSAAEAGIENALVIGTGTAPGSPVQIGDASYTSAVAGYAEGSTDFNYPLPMSSGDSMTTWFVSHDANGSLTCADNKCFKGSLMKVCWGKPGTAANSTTAPAVEVSVFYESTPGSLPSVKIARATADPNSGRAALNKFTSSDSGGCTISGVSYAFQKTINFGAGGLGIPAGSYGVQNGLQFAKVRMLYNIDQTQTAGVTVAGSGSTLPSQGSDIVSTGTAGQSNRKVEVFQGWPEPPSVFDAAIFGSGGLTKGAAGSGPAPGIVPTVGSFSSLLTGRVITLTYDNISDSSSYDWVGFFVPGAANTGFSDWSYLGSSGTCPQDVGDGAKSGSCQFSVPVTMSAGTYDVRLFSNNNFTQILLSNGSPATSTLNIPQPPPTTVSASVTNGVITVTYADIPSPTTSDWVGIYASSTDAYNTSKAMTYVKGSGSCPLSVGGDGVASGSCQFSLPATVVPGAYEVRLYSNNGSTLLASSSLVVPAPTPTPAPSVAPSPTPTVAPTPTP